MIIKSSRITNNTNGTINNPGTFDNQFSLINNATINITGSLLNKATGTFANNLIFNNNVGGTIDNDGIITLSALSVFKNYATVINDNSITDDGITRLYKTSNFTNNSQLTIKHIFRNYGALTNNSTVTTFDAEITNSGKIDSWNSLTALTANDNISIYYGIKFIATLDILNITAGMPVIRTTAALTATPFSQSGTTEININWDSFN